MTGSLSKAKDLTSSIIHEPLRALTDTFNGAVSAWLHGGYKTDPGLAWLGAAAGSIALGINLRNPIFAVVGLGSFAIAAGHYHDIGKKEREAREEKQNLTPVTSDIEKLQGGSTPGPTPKMPEAHL